jgi:Zn-finger nucleic acid-binding protein
MYYCPECKQQFKIIMDNLPEVSVEYCPNCGSVDIYFEDEDDE